MYLIKTCPSCGKRLRFPIDRGKIQIKCACGHKFPADPDDPALYRDSEFDLSCDNNKIPLRNFLKNRTGNLTINNIRGSVINSVLEIKYKIQNFKLLPVPERRKILILAISLIALAAIVIFLLSDIPDKYKISDPSLI